MSLPRWSGVFPAVTSKFTAQDRLDRAEMERCFRLQLDAGVDGLIVCGSLGEASTLEPDEKIEVLNIALGVADGKVPVLLTVSEGSTRRAAKLADEGAKAGAAGLMVLPAIPYRSDARETIAHYTSVTRAAGLPVMIYNNPVSYGVDITPAMLAEMAAEPLFVAIKESSDDVRRVTQIFNQLGNRYAVFTGVDNLALESLAVGVDGWVAGLVCAFPAETVAIYKLMKAERRAEALEIYRWFQPVLDLDVSTKLVQNIKLAEALAVGSNDVCRLPRMALTGAERKRVEDIVTTALKNRPDLGKYKI